MDTKVPPLFSVILTTHNRSGLVARAIRTVLSQTWRDFELIVVDDGSFDETREVIRGISDPRMKYVYQDNRGLSFARNTGVSHSIGSYVIFLDDDDEALPAWLEHLATIIIETETTAAIVCAGAMFLDPKGNVFEVRLPQDLGPMCKHQTGLFLTGCYAVRRDLFLDAGGYAPDCTRSQNTEFSWRIVPLSLERGLPIACVNTPVIRVHRHARLSSYANGKLEGVTYIIDRHQARMKQYPALLATHLGVAGVNAARVGSFSQARRLFLQAIHTHPFALRNYARLMALFTPLKGKLWRGSGLPEDTNP